MAVERENVFFQKPDKGGNVMHAVSSRRQCNRCVHGISFILIITGGACHIIERPIEI